MTRIYVGEDGLGKRADQYLALSLGYSRETIKKMFGLGEILIGGKPAKPSQQLKAGDAVDYEQPPEQEIVALPEDIPVDIAYEDDFIAVVNKEQGMTVHPSKPGESGTLVNALLYRMPLAPQGGFDRPGVVHRLDKDTSGLLAFAKTDAVFAALRDQFKEHTAKRRYHAIVHGNFANRLGAIETPFGRDPNNHLKMAVLSKSPRQAYTEYEVLEQFDGYSYLMLTLKTGRTHQIRVHMAYIGHPVIGDKRYGLSSKVDSMYSGQLLHAKELSFAHPATGVQMSFDSQIPSRFSPLLSQDMTRGL